MDFDEKDIVKDNPNKDELREWIGKSDYPIKSFFNSRGRVYRELGLKDKLANMEDDEKIEILSSDGMLIKRPIIIGEDTVKIGFKEEEWKELL